MPVVISEWHMVEVLTRFKHVRQAGIDAVHGELGSPEGTKIPHRSQDKTGAASLQHRSSALTLLRLLTQNTVLCPKGIPIHLQTGNRLKPVALLWSNIVSATRPQEPKNDKTALKQLK